MKRKSLWMGGASALVAVALLGTGIWIWGGLGPSPEPFFGPHQAGIVTKPQKFTIVAAFDLTTTSADELRGLFKGWTKASVALTQGLPLGPPLPTSAPAADTGETQGYKPSRLTLTFGVGPSVFDERFGLAEKRPAPSVGRTAPPVTISTERSLPNSATEKEFRRLERWHHR